MRFLYSKKRGFTLVEVVVIVGIVALLASVVIFNIQAAKKKARDTQRISDLGQIQLALRQYKDANGAYPDCKNGMVIGENKATPGNCADNIDTALAPYFTKVPSDPSGPNSATYKYVYDSKYDCRVNGNPPTATDETVIYAETSELNSNKNWGRNSPPVLGVCEPTGPANSIYGIVLGVEVP